MTSFVWTDTEVRRALGLNLRWAREGIEYRRISTDSRTVKPGDLFVALVGERFDGHDFVIDALARGAQGAIVSHTVPGDAGVPVYPVDDTTVALGALANHRRRALGCSVVGITGSSGKTTTKDLTEGALRSTYRVHATRGNLNNRIGLPLTILSAPDDVEVLVLEMGSNQPGEIGTLARIAAADVGVLTTVGETHLEKLGSREGVFREKLSLLTELPARGFAVVGDEPPELPYRARAIKPNVRVAGWSDRADPELRPLSAAVDEDGCFRFGWKGHKVSLRIPGRHSVQDALLALAVAELLDVPIPDAVAGVSAVSPASMRGEIKRIGALTVLLDCYNANPQSVRAAIDLLATLPADAGRVAVLGSMLELGERKEELHHEVLEEAAARNLDLIVASGEFARAALRSMGPQGQRGSTQVLAAPSVKDAYAVLKRSLSGREVILLKASRGVALESLVPLLEADFGEPTREPAGKGG